MTPRQLTRILARDYRAAALWRCDAVALRPRAVESAFRNYAVIYPTITEHRAVFLRIAKGAEEATA